MSTPTYYEALGVSRNATQDEIKKGYRKMALKYHPDKAGTSEEAAAKFEIVAKAYGTLSNEKTRQIYDQYGERGLEMMKQMGDISIIQDALLQANQYLMSLGLITALLIIFHSFLAVRIDGNNSWPYFAVFVPLFIIDIIALVFFARSLPAPKNEDQERISEEDRKSIETVKRMVLICFVLFTVFQILVCLQLDGATDISWWIVFIPWFVIEAALLIQNFLMTIAQCMEPVYDTEPAEGQEPEPRGLTVFEILQVTLRNFYFYAVRITQIILVILKLDGMSTDWRFIFFPSWILGFLIALRLVFDTLKVKYAKTVKPENTGKIIFDWVMFVIWAVLFYTFMALLVSRLTDGSSPSAAVIFIPIFIILALLQCCFSCCLPCVVQGAKMEFEQQMNMAPEEVQPEDEIIIAIDKRIEESAIPSASTQTLQLSN
ncbi:hypothetical protein HDV01_006845 [Terramyces sp. JEL0728]|nr:hypothetical protein HDV01_006845 [Terramyces sp. JEL0728]